MKRWAGPEPTDLQRLLLRACREPDETAHIAWSEWLAAGDFDREDPASIELAALAVSRLGPAVGQGSEVSRCRGWNRRTWYLSELALDVAESVGEQARQRGLILVAVGDLATRFGGHRFAGRMFPVRRVEFEVTGARYKDLATIGKARVSKAAAQAVETGRLPLTISSRSVRSLTATQAEGVFMIPDAAGHLAWLAARNWRPNPPGGLRWVLEVLAVLKDIPDPTALLPGVIAAAIRAGTPQETAAALRLVGSLPGGQAARPIAAALDGAVVPPLRRARLLAAKRYSALRR